MINLSIVIPFYNEELCVEETCIEVMNVMESATFSWELIAVNDGSKDKTAEILNNLSEKYDNFRVIHLTENNGQSAALDAGFKFAQGKLIATLDGDGQNDPKDIFKLMDNLTERQVDMMCGIRVNRADSGLRKISSKIANKIRASVLGDNVTDVGCAIRVFKNDCLKDIKFFRNAHRFFPALFIMAGYKIDEMPVNHRERSAGTSKYGRGINTRLWAGIFDLFGVYWLKKRFLRYGATEYEK